MNHTEDAVKKAGLIAGIVAALAIGAAPAAAKPGDIVAGDSTNSTVVRINAKTGATSVISDDPQFGRPSDTVFGRDGTIYVTDYGVHAVFSVDPKTGATDLVSDDPLFDTPDGIAMGPDGDLYVTNVDAPNGLLRVDLPSGSTSVVSDDPLLGGGPIGVVVPPDGIPIVADTDLIARVNPTTGAAVAISDPGDGLEGGDGLARGADGTLYFASQSGLLQAVDPATGAVTDLTGAIEYDGYGLAFDFHRRVVFGAGSDLDALDLHSGDIESVATDVGDNGYPEGFEVEPPKCKGKTATIVGSTKKDKLKGSKFKDVIATLGGNDKVNAKGGNDIVCGGKGKDKLKGGKGRDKLFGQAGKDKLNGGPGKDKERQ
jgi:Ca2+-binding RTX toxin-like protein